MVYRAVLSREWQGFNTRERCRCRMSLPEGIEGIRGVANVRVAFQELEAKEFPELSQLVFTRPITGFSI
jgi:hypothetical protein